MLVGAKDQGIGNERGGRAEAGGKVATRILSDVASSLVAMCCEDAIGSIGCPICVSQMVVGTGQTALRVQFSAFQASVSLQHRICLS